jgi:PAS domain S-box-containing protein
VRSLFGKLILSYLAVILVALGLLGLLLSNLFYNYYRGMKTRELVERGEQIAAVLAPYLEKEELRQQLPRQLELAKTAANAEICLLGPGDEVISRSGVPAGILEERGEAGPLAEVVRRLGPRIAKGEAIPCGEDMLVSEAEVRGSSGEPLGTLYLRARMAAVSATIERVRTLIVRMAVLSILVSAVLALWLSGRIAEPLAEMRTLAEKMAKGDYASRLKVRSRDEVGQLTHSLNSLAASLEKALGQLHSEQAKLRSILTSMEEGVIAVGADGEVLLANPQAPLLLGLRQEDLLGRQLALAGLPAALVEQIERCLSTKMAGSAELEVEAPGRALAAQVVPLQSGPGEAWGAVAVVRDISESRRLEDMRRRFVSDVSHELRTPLTSIAGYASALADGTAGDEGERARCAAVILQEAARLERLIGDLLDLSRMDSRAELRLEPTEVRPLLENAVASLQPQARERNLVVTLDLPSDLPRVLADPDRLYQVIINLLSNALRFNRQGGAVAISARQEPGWLRLFFRDTGPGLAAEELPLVWERFHRAEPSRSRVEGGTGLGLAIVKSIVQAHGGTVGAESKPGEGSTFSVTFPLAS